MPIMQLDQARVSDPVLTQIVHGYRQTEFVCNHLLPAVRVSTRAGKVIQFGKESFALHRMRRSPGSTITRKQSSFSSKGYELYQDAIAEEVAIEEYQEAMNGEARVNLRLNAPKRAMASVLLRLEYDASTLMQTASLYETSCTVALGTSDQWDNYASATSDPIQDVNNWKEAVRNQIGVYPNRANIGPYVFRALQEHPKILDKIKYTSSESVSLEMLARMLNLDSIKVCTVKYLSDTGQLLDVWGKSMVLGYVPEGASALPTPQSGISRETPSYGYTYTLDGYPMAEPERWDPDKGCWVYPVWAERSPELTGLGETGKVGGGFLARTLVA